MAARKEQDENGHIEETRRLLSDPEPTDDAPSIARPTADGRQKRPSLQLVGGSDHQRRSSALAQPRPDGTPRTPNRVRFDIDDPRNSTDRSNGHPDHPAWMDEEDYFDGDERESHSTSGEHQRVPLLTDIEAPSVTLAADLDFEPEDHLESARPRSNMRSAFMNMANSIMYVGRFYVRRRC